MKTRSMMVALLALGSVPFVAGCQQDEAKAPVEAIVMDAHGAAQLPPGSGNGRSPKLGPDAPEGFWVGRGASGEYYLRTTTQHKQHRFHGRIRPQNGELTNFRPTRMDMNDRFRFDGKDIVFDIKTQGEQDGFDFGVSKGGCVEMDLRIDSKSMPEHIHVGEKEVKPPMSHFSFCP